MLGTVANITGTLVLSKDQLGYQEVVDQIPSANRVAVVTYNISASNDCLLKALRECDAEVRLITNIPGRFESYMSANARDRASSKMTQMFRKLNPDRFGPLAKILFCFRNHAKIILTDAVAYVGSANFSEESAGSWESGVIVRDSQTISEIELWVDSIEADSLRFYGRTMQGAIKPLLLIKSRLESVANTLNCEFSTDDLSELSDVIEAVNDAVNESDRAWAEAFSTCGPLTSQIDMSVLQAIEEWTNLNEVCDLARTNEFLLKAMNGDIPVDQFVTDNDGNIPEDAFQVHIEELMEEQENLFEAIKPKVEDMRCKIVCVCGQIEAVFQDISTHIEQIDNTK